MSNKTNSAQAEQKRTHHDAIAMITVIAEIKIAEI